MRFSTLRLLLLPAIVAHNAEEWISLPQFGAISPALARLGFSVVGEPPERVMRIALLLVAIVSAAIVLAGAWRRSRWLDILSCWVAAVYLANVFLPHLVEFALDRGYEPGLLTGVFVNLPICGLLLAAAVREGVLARRQLVFVIVAGTASLGPAIVLAIQAAERIAAVT